MSRQVPTHRDVTLVELLDRILDKGVILSGDIMLSVAGIDLVYVSLRALVASVETAAAYSQDAFAKRQKARGIEGFSNADDLPVRDHRTIGPG